MRRLAVFASGSGTNFEAIVTACERGVLDAEVVLMVCDKPGAKVVERAAAHEVGAFVFAPKQYASKADYEREIVARLDAAGVELVCLAGYMRIIGDELLGAYGGRIINIHPSLIPKYCGKGFYGKRVHKAVLEGGEKESGATVHFVDEGVDTGEIILQEKVPVLEGDTPDELAARVLKVEHRILAEGLNQIAAKIQVEKMKSDEKGGKR